MTLASCTVETIICVVDSIVSFLAKKSISFILKVLSCNEMVKED